jgi:hypothetical protein
MIPHTPTTVNKKHRVYIKKRSQLKSALSHDLPLVEEDFADKGEPVNQNNTYLLDNLSQMLNCALSRMTDAIDKIFSTTIQEVHNESKKKVSDQKQIQQDTRTTAIIRANRKRLPSLHLHVSWTRSLTLVMRDQSGQRMFQYLL